MVRFKVHSPLLAVGMEISVDLYDEEEVWENKTNIIATMLLSLTSEGIPTLTTNRPIHTSPMTNAIPPSTMAIRKPTDTGECTLTAAGEFSSAPAGQAENPILASGWTDNPTLIHNRAGGLTLIHCWGTGTFTLARSRARILQ